MKKFGIKDKNYQKAVLLNDEGEPATLPASKKVAGITQVVAGGVMCGAGVPLMALPVVGSTIVITGATVALNGQRKLSGRPATRVEYALENAGASIAHGVAGGVRCVSNQSAKRIREVSKKVGEHVPECVSNAATNTKDAVLSVAERVPATAVSATKTAREVAHVACEEGPVAVAGLAAGMGAVAGVVAGAVYAGAKVVGKLK